MRGTGCILGIYWKRMYMLKKTTSLFFTFQARKSLKSHHFFSPHPYKDISHRKRQFILTKPVEISLFSIQTRNNSSGHYIIWSLTTFPWNISIIFHTISNIRNISSFPFPMLRCYQNRSDNSIRCDIYLSSHFYDLK